MGFGASRPPLCTRVTNSLHAPCIRHANRSRLQHQPGVGNRGQDASTRRRRRRAGTEGHNPCRRGRPGHRGDTPPLPGEQRLPLPLRGRREARPRRPARERRVAGARGPHDALHERLRLHQGGSRLHGHPHHHRVRAQPALGQGARPRPGRGRLRNQAVRPYGGPRVRARGAAPVPPGQGRPARRGRRRRRTSFPPATSSSTSTPLCSASAAT